MSKTQTPNLLLKQSREFTPNECSTVLAALRHWQRTLESDRDRLLREFDEYWEDGAEPLTIKEIDDLCESINLGGFQVSQ